MNYFKEYEKLKESKQLIHIGSIWEDYFWKVQIIEVTSASVYFMCFGTRIYNKRTFLEKYTRVE